MRVEKVAGNKKTSSSVQDHKDNGEIEDDVTEEGDFDEESSSDGGGQALAGTKVVVC